MFNPPDTKAAIQPRSSALDGGQYLENLATAYWYSEALFAALELEIFPIMACPVALEDLAKSTSCKPAELERLLITLESLNIVSQTVAVQARSSVRNWQLTALAHRYLAPDSPEYLGDFLLYRRYLQTPWQKLAARISSRPLPDQLSPDDDYPTRTLYYVRALDALARRKAMEISNLAGSAWQMPVLDIGGGAASLSRCLLKGVAGGRAVLLEIAEVLAAAAVLYPHKSQWTGIEKRAGDFRKAEFSEDFGTILMANMLHIYNPHEAKQLIGKAAGLLKPGGLLLVHDYFPDRPGPALAKGALYDLNMMLNTYEGHCHTGNNIMNWLKEAGLCAIRVNDLGSDSSIITARSNK